MPAPQALHALVALAGVSFAGLATAADDSLPTFSPPEIRRILQHGPWPAATPRDPSNRVSGHAPAIDLGGRLFFDVRLSPAGTVACSTCHLPERSFTDGRERGVGLAPVDRNTPSVLNQRQNRWYGLDGGGDSLWMQSIRPILDPPELASGPRHVAMLVRRDADYSCRYRKAFGRAPPRNDELVMVDVAKALAAYQETLVTGRTPFDEFRDALARGDADAASRYPAAAQRGLKIFIGKGNCAMCHLGPNFTNGEFHDIGVPFFVGPGRVDPGRYEGIRKLLASPYTLLGVHNDDPARSTATGTRHVARTQRNFGEFRVPSLRNVGETAPYMHNGRFGTLAEVVRHYSELPEDRLHADGERILVPLHLTDGEVTDLVAFLESLTDVRTRWQARSPADAPACR